jgi:DNA invertase Pin-like site-specific DNA recombinase
MLDRPVRNGRGATELSMSTMDRNDLNEMIERAIERGAEAGAKKALASVGLHDDKAGEDVTDLRRLLESYRTTKRQIKESIATTITKAILLGIAVAVAAYLKLDFITGR